MTYIPDLSLYTFWGMPYGPIYAIGWLDGSEPYTQGKASLAMLETMNEWTLNIRESAILWTRGFHLSNLENVPEADNVYPPGVLAYKKRNLNNGEFHVHHKGKYYASPVMIFNYILENNYLPPEEYIEAVIHGELVTEDNMEEYSKATGEVFQKLFEEASAKLDAGEYKASLQIADQLYTILPNEPILFALRGSAYCELGEIEKAQIDLERSLGPMKEEGGQNYAHVLGYLGKIAHMQGNYQKSQSLLREAIQADPDNPEVRSFLANLI